MSVYYFPPSASLSESSSLRFFFCVDGVLANFTTHAASYMDDLKLPFPANGIFEESMLQNHFVPEVLYDICNGREFWENVPMYPWSWMMFERAYIMSKANVYFISKAYDADPGSWGGKAAWVHKNFGSYGVNRLVLSLDIANLCMLVDGKTDVLISPIKRNIDAWISKGGTGLYFQELDVRSSSCIEEVGRRLDAINEAANAVTT